MILGRFLFGAVQGTVTVGKPRQAGQLISKTPPTDVPQQAVYGNYVVPSDFKKITTSAPVFPVVESYDYIKTKGGYNEIAVQIVKLITGSLSDDGTYNLRAAKPDQYIKSTVQVQGKPATMFYDAQNTNATIYLQRGDIVVHVSLTGPMAAETDKVVGLANNWHWN